MATTRHDFMVAKIHLLPWNVIGTMRCNHTNVVFANSVSIHVLALGHV